MPSAIKFTTGSSELDFDPEGLRDEGYLQGLDIK